MLTQRPPSLGRAALFDLRGCWKPLVRTDIVCKLVAFVLLTPVVGLLLRILLAASGNPLLADQDIVYFLLGPAGWVCFVAICGLSVGIVALELAALLYILGSCDGQPAGTVEALRFVTARAWRVLQVTARMAGLTLLAAVPFVLIAAGVYALLLSRFDINFYLQQRPPEFYLSLVIGGVLLTLLAAVLLRLFTGWFFALPLIVFEDATPHRALRLSRDRARGNRLVLLAWMLGWAAASFLLSALATTAVLAAGRMLVPLTAASLPLLTVAIGMTLSLSLAVNLAINLLGTVVFAVLLFRLYQNRGGNGYIGPPRRTVAASSGSRAWPRITRLRLVGASGLAIVVAAAVGAFAVLSLRLVDDCRVTAHRGASLSAPENTLAAIRQAIADGADAVEIDVQETADGHVVVMHDSDFMKLAGSDLKIWDATLAELADLDIGSWFAPEFADQRVPTLAAVLEECRGKCGVVIELKYYGHAQRLEERVAEVVDAHEMADQIVIMSLNATAVEKMKSLRPGWRVGLVLSVSAGDLSATGADFLAVNARFADRRLAKACHRRGMEVYVWTVNDAATMSTMISRGVDNLITDDPTLARRVLRQRAEMSVPQRLLLEFSEVLGIRPKLGEL